ncbi:rod shape-determining protein MreC [Lysobacter arvi]|uniref:Cell shape-determining protein MreC n=1 Tax=Lysobacter arvi TaxID=3038776 RepID=A0ABU1CGP1_9GAMM|nr:rod shape-determining protein MreC [Lysobacter arvi]MDR0184130.1 rod shape-determining protein MreC [Lysobacter arvi]
MPTYAGPPTSARSGDVAGTLRLLAYLALAVVLIVLDHRGGWLAQVRQQVTLLVQPLWMAAGWPGQVVDRVREDAGTIAQLTAENRRLRKDAMFDQARIARLATLAADNARLRGLLDAAEDGNLDAFLAPVLDIDLDPARQRLVLNAGSHERVQVGQNVIDANGLLGQVIAVTPMYANVLLLTDPSHAVPVAVARNGVRLVVYGEGRSDKLRLTSVPLSSDVKVGDVLVTSGLGGRFAPGFPVGKIASLKPDDSRAFLVGEVTPAAQLDRGREVLVLLSMPNPLPGATAFTPADAAGTGAQPAGAAPTLPGGAAQAPAAGASTTPNPPATNVAPPPSSPAANTAPTSSPAATPPAPRAPANGPDAGAATTPPPTAPTPPEARR